jgi:hypothetical protein
VGAFRKEITDDDCQDVESLGWLYQFYIAAKKDEVMARKKAVPTEDIPAVTQLFTPHWIVRYLVENSLGRLWLLNRPGSKLRDHMPYYIEGETETDFLVINKPEEIKLLDPACGSGHMLTYAFDLLVLIYEEEGYSPNEIPGLILKNNLHGLEICPRAAQLAELALVFKAREQSRRFFQPEQLVRPQIIELQDVQFADGELNDYIEALDLGELFDPSLFTLLHQFEEAKNIGSLIQPCLDERTIANARRAIEAKDLGGQLFLRETHLKFLSVLEQAEALTQRYHVVVANPPYLGMRMMNGALKLFVETELEEAKADLFSCFMVRCVLALKSHGYCSMVTMQSWMFLPSFLDLRKRLLGESPIVSMAHLGPNAFGTISGEVVQTTAFILEKGSSPERIGTYLRLVDFGSEPEKEEALVQRDCLHQCPTTRLKRIDGFPVVYWASEVTVQAFESGVRLEDIAQPRQGLSTNDNGRFLRFWHETAFERIGFDFPSLEDARQSGRRWFPFNKGGSYRKWYGNNEYVVDWENDGQRLKKLASDLYGSATRTIKNISFYFKPGLTWSRISTDNFCVRISPKGYIFADNGCCAFPEVNTEIIGAFLNSSLATHLLRLLNPTLTFQVGDVKALRFRSNRLSDFQATISLVDDAVSIARTDWDNFETSWDFRDQPLLRPRLKGTTLEASWRNWEAQSTAAIRRMQELETENNRLFISAYGLDGELQPEVPQEQITLARAEARRDVASFLSYATGCMMGRYSLDQPGLILADLRNSQDEQLAAYVERVDQAISEVKFKPDPDGIIPVLDGEWFEDDIVARTREFLEITFPESTVTDNLRFIEESLGKDIRKYFCSDFYKDHLQTYKKRPIYWMVQSPKKGFACLIYLHRYTKDTLNQVLNNYFRTYLRKLEARLVKLGLDQLNDSLPTRERTAARKEAEKITKVLKECEAWEQDALLPLAQQRIELDLDDGVKVNYLKLQDVLAPIPGLAAKED